VALSGGGAEGRIGVSMPRLSGTTRDSKEGRAHHHRRLVWLSPPALTRQLSGRTLCSPWLVRMDAAALMITEKIILNIQP